MMDKNACYDSCQSEKIAPLQILKSFNEVVGHIDRMSRA